MASKKKRLLTRDDWLKEGLAALATEGPEALRIDRLAKRLGVARSSYYWHFEDRKDFVQALLHFWLHELTEIVLNDPEIRDAEPRDQLRLTAEMVDRYELGKYDPQFRTWALTEPLVAGGVQRVNRARMDFVRGIFEKLGFAGDELEMRATLFVVYQTWERSMFRELSTTRRQALRERRLTLLMSKTPR